MFEVIKATSETDLKEAVIANSQTLSVGEVILPQLTGDANVVVTGGGTVRQLLGIVVAIQGNNKILGVNTHAAAADNETVDRVKVKYLPLSFEYELRARLTGDAGTTVDRTGGYAAFKVDSTGLLLDETASKTWTDTAGTQFISYGLLDPDNDNRTVTCRYAPHYSSLV